MNVEAARHLIERRYATVHGAVQAADYPHFCIVDSGPEMGPTAALGFRLAGEERLFLEDYLDDPIERAVSEKIGIRVNRDRIVEIGAHASAQSRATVALWARTARHLNGIADVAVASVNWLATRPKARSAVHPLDVERQDLGEGLFRGLTLVNRDHSAEWLARDSAVDRHLPARISRDVARDQRERYLIELQLAVSPRRDTLRLNADELNGRARPVGMQAVTRMQSYRRSQPLR